MGNGLDQPSKVELDAALRSMIREVDLVGARPGMHTEEVDLELRFTLEVDASGEARPVVHLGPDLPASEVHSVRVALKPRADVLVVKDIQSAKSTEIDLATAAKEAVARAAALAPPDRSADQPSEAEAPSARGPARGAGAAASPPPPASPPPQPRILPATSPRLRLRKASPDAAASGGPGGPNEPTYRSEVDVRTKQGPVVEERHAAVKVAAGSPPLVLDDRRERSERREGGENRREATSPPDSGEPRPGRKLVEGDGGPFLVFASQRKQKPEVAIEMLDTAEFGDDAGDTMVTGIPPGGEPEDTDTE